MKNIVLSFFLILALAASASAQVQTQMQFQMDQDQFYSIDDFSKLLESHSNEFGLDKGTASDAQNVRANEQYKSLAKRTALNLLGTCHSSAATGLHRYYRSDNTKYTVTSSSTFVDYISDSGVCTNLKALLTSGKRWNFLTYNNFEIGTDGSDMPLKWDGAIIATADTVGARTAGDLATDLGAPFAQIASGTGLTASRWYQYRVAYYDGVTYHYSTSRSNPLLLGTTNKQILLNAIPLGPLGTTQRIIYRTVGDTTRALVVADNTFDRVTTISDNTTTTYLDSMDDGTLGANTAPTLATVQAGENVTPPKAAYPFIFKDKIWFGNDSSGTAFGKSALYFSETTNPDYWRAVIHYFLIRPDDGDEITFVKSFNGILTVGKTNSISKIYTDAISVASWSVSQPFSFLGCVAPYSATITPLGIVYLGRYGIYKFDGQQSTLISDVVTKDIRDISPTNLANVAGILYNNEYRLAYASQATGSAVNDRVLLFDLIRNSYTKDTEHVNVWTIYNSADDFGALYSGASSTDGDILAHTTQPTALVFRYKSDLINTSTTDTSIVSGTVDGAYVGGTQDAPILSLGWNGNWLSAGGRWNGKGSATWQVQKSPGYWYSPVIQVGANAFSKLYWNENLGTHGDVTFAIRSDSNKVNVTYDTWSVESSNPDGSDISAIAANNYVQLRSTLSTTNFAESPYLFVNDSFMIKLVYSQTGTAAESSILSLWQSGWLDFISQYGNYPKLIKEVDVYYEGTSGTMNFTVSNLKGDVVSTFAIDLSKNRLDSANYYGSGLTKVYRYLPPLNNGPNLIYGDKFILNISENGTTPWKVQKIVFRYSIKPYVPYTNN